MTSLSYNPSEKTFDANIKLSESNIMERESGKNLIPDPNKIKNLYENSGKDKAKTSNGKY